MSLPVNDPDTLLDSFLQERPPDYGDLAIEFKAFSRARKIKTPAQLMQVVMCYCGIDQALRDTAGTFALLEERITDTAIHKRLKACLPWVKALLRKMMGQEIEGLEAGRLRFIVVDGSTVQGPGAKETWYRLHIAIDLVNLQLVHVEVTDKYEGEHLDHYPLQDGDVVLIDRGYNQPKTLIAQASKGVSLVLRYNAHGMNLYRENGEKINWYEELKSCQGKTHCIKVQVRHKGEYIEGYVHACRLPPEQAAQARRRVRANAKKKGHTVRQSTLRLAEWILVFTTLPPSLLSSDTIAQLYRVRWQVELVIKRMKSLLDIDQLRAREGGELAALYLHGKLLYTWVVEKRARRRCGPTWNRLDQTRSATWWRLWKRITQEIDTMIEAVSAWDLSRWEACLEVMQERPRKRALQILPNQVISLIDQCRTAGVSNI
ncbi:MAG: transposase [Aestuariibacter sp.]|nr:transposase [Aestuariibacter sp.]